MSVQSLVVLHPVDPVREVAGEEDGRQLHHAQPEDGGRHVAEVINEDVLHHGQTASAEDGRTLREAGGGLVLKYEAGQERSGEVRRGQGRSLALCDLTWQQDVGVVMWAPAQSVMLVTPQQARDCWT